METMTNELTVISKTAMLKSGLFSNNSYAVNIPPGPAPTINTSYILLPPKTKKLITYVVVNRFGR